VHKKQLMECDLEILISLENWFDLEVDKKTIVLKANVDRTAQEIIKELKNSFKVKGVLANKPLNVPILKMSVNGL